MGPGPRPAPAVIWPSRQLGNQSCPAAINGPGCHRSSNFGGYKLILFKRLRRSVRVVFGPEGSSTDPAMGPWMGWETVPGRRRWRTRGGTWRLRAGDRGGGIVPVRPAGGVDLPSRRVGPYARGPSRRARGARPDARAGVAASTPPRSVTPPLAGGPDGRRPGMGRVVDPGRRRRWRSLRAGLGAASCRGSGGIFRPGGFRDPFDSQAARVLEGPSGPGAVARCPRRPGAGVSER